MYWNLYVSLRTYWYAWASSPNKININERERERFVGRIRYLNFNWEKVNSWVMAVVWVLQSLFCVSNSCDKVASFSQNQGCKEYYHPSSSLTCSTLRSSPRSTKARLHWRRFCFVLFIKTPQLSLLLNGKTIFQCSTFFYCSSAPSCPKNWLLKLTKKERLEQVWWEEKRRCPLSNIFWKKLDDNNNSQQQ